MSTAMLPTPPEAPVTAIGPPVGDWPFCSRRWMASAAVNPAVPSAMAVKASRPSGIGMTQSPRTPPDLAEPPSGVSGHPQPVTGTPSPGPVARIARALHDARQIDAADQRVAAQDLAGPGRRERVLVVDVGVADPDHDLPGCEVIEGDRLVASGNLAPFGMNAERLESGSHMHHHRILDPGRP